jgi:DNA repair protein SbcD/Mre11
MRFLHAADIHLDSPLLSQALRDPERARRLHGASRLALVRLVDTAIEENVAALILAGDIFDNGVGNVTSRIALATELRRLSRAGIPTVAIRGNHDALLDYTRYGLLEEGVVILDAAQPTCRVAKRRFTASASRAGTSRGASCRATRRPSRGWSTSG